MVVVSVGDVTIAPSVPVACDKTADGEGCALVLSKTVSGVLGDVSVAALVAAADCD
jgi:hypothetical protein